MKKISLLLVSIIFGTAVLLGQTGQTVDGLLKAISKSDAEIADAKKNSKSATWEKRGDLFLEVSQFTTKGLYQGMAQTGLTGAEIVMGGKPSDIKASGETEEWIYERVTLRFTNGLLDSWEETKPIDPDALDKAYEAYKKADELDDKGKFRNKTNVKLNIAILRGSFVASGVDLFSKKEFAKAVQNLEKALILAEYPKPQEDDFKVGLVTYYAGLIAFNGKDYETAKKHYQTCIDKGYEDGTPYNAMAALYKETGDSEKELAILQKGFEKYPESKELLIGFINYYLGAGLSDKALEKLDQAITDDPTNPTFYSAKATLYDNMSKDSTGKYSESEKKALIDKAIEGYKKSIEIKPDFFDPNFNIAVLIYNQAVYKINKADGFDPRKQQKEFDEMMADARVDLENALPYMERAHEIDPMERTTIQTLITIYHRLQKYDKKKEMQEKLDNLPMVKTEGL